MSLKIIISFFVDNINTFSLLGALIGFLWGVYQYKKSIDLKRAEWIHKIFNTFYLEEKFKHIKKGVVYAETLDPSIAEVLKYYIAKSNGKPLNLPTFSQIFHRKHA